MRLSAGRGERDQAEAGPSDEGDAGAALLHRHAAGGGRHARRQNYPRRH